MRIIHFLIGLLFIIATGWGNKAFSIVGNYSLKGICYSSEPNSHQSIVSIAFDNSTKLLQIESLYQKQNIVVEIYSIDGSKVKRFEINEKKVSEFNLSNLRNGLYLIKFICGNKVQLEKFVISD